MRKRCIAVVLAAVMMISVPTSAMVGPGGPEERSPPESEASDQERVTLRLDTDPSPALVEDLEATGATVAFTNGGALPFIVVEGTGEQIAAAEQHEAVEDSEPDGRYHVLAEDEHRERQWAPDAIGLEPSLATLQEAGMDPAWGAATDWWDRYPYGEGDGSGGEVAPTCVGAAEDIPANDPSLYQEARQDRCVVVSVLDTGVDSSHPDLAGAWRPALDLTDDEMPGYDPYGHGTHVAGIIGATTGNTEGIASPGGRTDTFVDDVKVLNSEGWGYWSWIAAGIINATHRGADILSMSLGGAYPSDTIQDAIDVATARDVLVVAAAGNDYGDQAGYPASYPGVLSVSATAQDGEAAYFTSTGSAVDLAAPGHLVVSALPTNEATLKDTIAGTDLWEFVGDDRIYGELSGTSMATPEVSGAAALLWHALLDPACREAPMCERWAQGHGIDRRVALLLEASAVDKGPAGWDPIYGWGEIDLDRAVERLFAGNGSNEASPAPGDDLLPGPLADQPLQQRSDPSENGFRRFVTTGPGPVQAYVGQRHAEQPWVEHIHTEDVEVSLRIDPAVIGQAGGMPAPGVQTGLTEGTGDAWAVNHGEALLRGRVTKTEYVDIDPDTTWRNVHILAEVWSDTAGAGASSAADAWWYNGASNGIVTFENHASAAGCPTPSQLHVSGPTVCETEHSTVDRPGEVLGQVPTGPIVAPIEDVAADLLASLEDAVAEPFGDSDLEEPVYDVRSDTRNTTRDATGELLEVLPEG